MDVGSATIESERKSYFIVSFNKTRDLRIDYSLWDTRSNKRLLLPLEGAVERAKDTGLALAVSI